MSVRDLQGRLAREVAPETRPERPSRARTAARAPSPVPEPPETAKALQARLDAEYEAQEAARLETEDDARRARPFAHLFGRAEDLYEALTRRRYQCGWTGADVDHRCGWTDSRRVSKLEPLRHGVDRARGSSWLRDCARILLTAALWRIMSTLGLVILIVDETTADAVLARAASPPIPEKWNRTAALAKAA